jgi:hypothetical protein
MDTQEQSSSNAVDDKERFVTVDRWRHATDFLRLSRSIRRAVQMLDVQLEALTESETKLGAFTAADGLPFWNEEPEPRM